LPPGDYAINIDANRFGKYSEKLIVAEKIGIRQEIEKNIMLLPKDGQGAEEQPKENVKPLKGVVPGSNKPKSK
jgi:hypothetical protein